MQHVLVQHHVCIAIKEMATLIGGQLHEVTAAHHPHLWSGLRDTRLSEMWIKAFFSKARLMRSVCFTDSRLDSCVLTCISKVVGMDFLAC